MTRRSRRAGLAAVGLAASVVVPVADAAAAGTPLPIPNPLTGNWTAPPGSYTMPATVVVDRAVTVDLSAATVTGSDGYLFTLRNGGRLTVVGGTLRGTVLGLVHDTVTAGGSGSVTITNTSLTDVRCIVCADGAGGPIDARLSGVRATGLGDGVRAVTNALDVHDSVLTGGGAPPLGSPAGLHSLDD
ncbi:MAG TPA: hypothetical protein VFU35_12185, partial [Jatrophihabitans sp.]|nr:hypothetical protein [Jatrophihabitans sp.]